MFSLPLKTQCALPWESFQSPSLVSQHSGHHCNNVPLYLSLLVFLATLLGLAQQATYHQVATKARGQLRGYLEWLLHCHPSSLCFWNLWASGPCVSQLRILGRADVLTSFLSRLLAQHH